MISLQMVQAGAGGIVEGGSIASGGGGWLEPSSLAQGCWQ